MDALKRFGISRVHFVILYESDGKNDIKLEVGILTFHTSYSVGSPLVDATSIKALAESGAIQQIQEFVFDRVRKTFRNKRADGVCEIDVTDDEALPIGNAREPRDFVSG